MRKLFCCWQGSHDRGNTPNLPIHMAQDWRTRAVFVQQSYRDVFPCTPAFASRSSAEALLGRARGDGGLGERIEALPPPPPPSPSHRPLRTSYSLSQALAPACPAQRSLCGGTGLYVTLSLFVCIFDHRIQVSDRWRATELNGEFAVSGSYPSRLYIPAEVTVWYPTT